MKTDLCLLNHASAPFDASKSCWAHVCPFGEHPWVSNDGKETITQVIDRAAVEAMAKSYPVGQPASRMDVDHLSMSAENTTEASGWGKETQIRDDGLWVRFDLTSHGQPLVNGKVYQFTSPCFPRDGLVDLGNGRMRVTKLGVIALTNDPNLRGQKPLTNRRTPAASKHTNTTMDYKAALLKVLGLPPDATDDQISAAVAAEAQEKGVQNTRSARIKELETQLVNRDLDEHKVTDVKQRELLAPMLTNAATRDTTLELLKQAKPPEAPKPLHNRGTGAQPKALEDLSKSPKTDAEREDVATADLHNRAQAYRARNGGTYDAALAAARNGATV